MTDTDTRAAIHAAIRDLFLGSSTPAVARVTIDAAITAHVEAEVTRRLAVAPGVETALAAYGTAVYDLGYVLHRPDRDAVLRPIKDTAEATLRAAIAADRERAVREATEPRITASTGVVPVVADAEGRMLGGRREGLDTIYDQVKVPVARDKARPTPDEARRLVDAYGCDAAMHGALGATGDTRTALLRALGVQA